MILLQNYSPVKFLIDQNNFPVLDEPSLLGLTFPLIIIPRHVSANGYLIVITNVVQDIVDGRWFSYPNVQTNITLLPGRKVQPQTFKLHCLNVLLISSIVCFLILPLSSRTEPRTIVHTVHTVRHRRCCLFDYTIPNYASQRISFKQATYQGN